MTQLPSLAIVVPCYNEEAVLPSALTALTGLLTDLIKNSKIAPASHLYFIDDGSMDSTWNMLADYAQREQAVIAVKLTINRGHQNALYAGLMQTNEDIVVSIDADLQDDLDCIEKMIDAHQQGNAVVFGVRDNRDVDSVFKRQTAESYYRFMRLLGVDLVYNHADFRLMSRPVLEALREYPESNLFLRGIIPKIGFRSTVVTYERKQRLAGETKYPVRKMLSFAWEGITAFSTAPLRAITVLGFVSGWLSVMTLVWVLGTRLFTDQAVPGWASILLPLLFIGSVQLVSLGIIGEYLAKIFAEVKRRPRFHVEKVLGVKKG